MRAENRFGRAGRPRGEKDIGRIGLRNERFRDGLVLIEPREGLSHISCLGIEPQLSSG